MHAKRPARLDTINVDGLIVNSHGEIAGFADLVDEFLKDGAAFRFHASVYDFQAEMPEAMPHSVATAVDISQQITRGFELLAHAVHRWLG